MSSPLALHGHVVRDDVPRGWSADAAAHGHVTVGINVQSGPFWSIKSNKSRVSGRLGGLLSYKVTVSVHKALSYATS